jgi:hypothetical protein
MLAAVDNEELAEGKPMWINGASLPSLARPLCGCAVVVALIIAIGFTGPAPTTFTRTERNVSGLSSLDYTFEATSLSSYNRFLAFEISARRAPGAAPPALPFLYEAGFVDSATRAGAGAPAPARAALAFAASDGAATPRRTLLYDDCVDYTVAQLRVAIAAIPAGYAGISLFAVVGAHERTAFQVHFRVLHCAFVAGALWRFAAAVRRAGGAWRPEQRLAAAVAALAVLAYNPSYALHAWRARRLLALWELAAGPLLQGALAAAALALLGAVDGRRARPGAPAAAVAAALAAAGIAARCARRAPGAAAAAPALLRAAQALFVAAAALALARAAAKGYATDSARLVAYAAAAACAAAAPAFGALRGGDPEEESVVAFACANAFALMALFWHWPGQPLHAYDAPADTGKLDNQAFVQEEEELGDSSDREEESSRDSNSPHV